MDIFMTVCLIIIVLLVIIFVVYFIMMYNSLIRLRNNIDKAWSNIDVLLKQRMDELTNQLETVKGYMKHEEQVFTKITEARTRHFQAQSVHQKAEADSITTSALKSLFAVAENYPDLKASDNFLKFQVRISEIENYIADRREFYNDSVNTYNIRIEQIPYVFVARLLNYTRRDLFRATDSDRRSFGVRL